MTDQPAGEPIAYTALEPGTTVVASDGSQIGKVAHVLAIPEEDLFDGVVIDTDAGVRFVDRDQVAEIMTTRVLCDLSAEQAANLPAPEGEETYHVDATKDTGEGLSARFGRLFHRERWIRDDK